MSDGDPERTAIRSGRNFEREYRLSTEEAGRFLIDLGELEIEFESVGDEELEIELELAGRPDETGPDVR